MKGESLRCVNCGAVYHDGWSVRESPICPWCGYSWYECTDDAVHSPTKISFRSRVENQIAKSSFDCWEKWTFWERYHRLRALWDRCATLDAELVHRRALSVAKSSMRPNLLQITYQLFAKSMRKHKKRVRDLSEEDEDPQPLWAELLDALCPLEDEQLADEGQNVERQAVARIMLEEAARLWEESNRRVPDEDRIPLFNALGISSPPESKRRYRRIRERLRRFRNRCVENWRV